MAQVTIHFMTNQKMRQNISFILDVPKHSLKLHDLTHSLKSLKIADHWHAPSVDLNCLFIKIDEPHFLIFPQKLQV